MKFPPATHPRRPRRQRDHRLGAIACLCAAACGLVLAFPAQGSDDVNDLLRQGVAEVGYLDFRKADGFFSRALAVAVPGSPQWQQAIIGHATAIQHISPTTQANVERAASLLGQLLDAAPDSPYAPRAMMQLARIAELRDYRGDTPDPEGARQWYRKVRDRWSGDPIAGEATFRIAMTHITTRQPDQVNMGIAELRQWLAAHPNDPLASAMWEYLGQTYKVHPISPIARHPWHDMAESIRCFMKADELGFTQPGREGPVYWAIGQMAQGLMARAREAGRSDEADHYRQLAQRYYRKLIRKAPNSGLGWPAWRILTVELGVAMGPYQQVLDEAVFGSPATQPAGAEEARP